jgi:hypothetical protein
MGAGVTILNTVTRPWGLPKMDGFCLVGPSDFQVLVPVPEMLKRFRQVVAGALQDEKWPWPDFICSLPPMIASIRAALRRVQSSPFDDEDRTLARWSNILTMMIDRHTLAEYAKDIPTWKGWEAEILANDPLHKLMHRWHRLQVPEHPRAESDVLKIFEIC